MKSYSRSGRNFSQANNGPYRVKLEDMAHGTEVGFQMVLSPVNSRLIADSFTLQP